MAVAVHQQVAVAGPEALCDLRVVGQRGDQFVQQDRPIGDEPGVGAGNEIEPLLAQRQQARRLRADDRQAAGRQRSQRLDVAARPVAGQGQLAA